MKMQRTPSVQKRVSSAWFALVMMAMTTLTVGAQIRIPKIPRPRPTQPTQPAPTSPAEPGQPPPSSPARRDNPRQRAGETETTMQPAGNFIDDGYTWFEAVSTEELNAQHRPVTTGWALSSQLRLIGDYPKRSGFKVIVSRAGNALATTRCEAFKYDSEPRKSVLSQIVTISCLDKTKTVKELGKFDVEIIAINGDNDAETSVRKYKIDVLKVDRIGGGFSNPQPDAPHYYISRHAEAPVSFLFLRPSNAHSYIGYDERSPIKNKNTVEIYFNLSPSADEKMREGYLSCAVDGKQLEMPGPRPYADKTELSADRHYEEVYTDRLAPAYKSGTPYRDEVRFSMMRMVLPLTFGTDGDSSRLTMKNYPGNWQCSLMSNGETWRTWRWTVGRDGMPIKHAEQNGNVNLSYNTYLIDTEIPAGGSKLDKRLASTSAAEGLFYGRPWTSAEGRAMAAKVPTKGSPAPVPSNKVK